MQWPCVANGRRHVRWSVKCTSSGIGGRQLLASHLLTLVGFDSCLCIWRASHTFAVLSAAFTLLSHSWNSI